MKYKRQNFGMKLSEAANLGDALKYCNNLVRKKRKFLNECVDSSK